MKPIYSHEIRALPKIDLHRHLDCSMRFSTMIEVASSIGLSISSDYMTQRDTFLVTQPMKDLESVLIKFLNAQKLLASEEILTRLAFEACEDAFNDGVRILELRYAPTFIIDGHAHLSFEKIHLAFVKGVNLAQKKFPIAVGLICIIQRNKSLAIAESVVHFAIEQKDTFVGLDIADNEEAFDAKIFAPLFQKAKNSGLHITAHSGESPSRMAAQRIYDSVDILGAERIGHGVQAIHDTTLMTYLKEKQIPLEVCPISNWLTQAFPTYESHPIQKLIQNGVLITVNSDDPGIFNTTLSDDFEVLHRVHSWKEKDFKDCQRTAYLHTFISEAQKSPFKELFL